MSMEHCRGCSHCDAPSNWFGAPPAGAPGWSELTGRPTDTSCHKLARSVPNGLCRRAMEADMGIADLPRPVGYVLGGGGSLGAVQVGMLQALSEHAVAPDIVAGTSVGS